MAPVSRRRRILLILVAAIAVAVGAVVVGVRSFVPPWLHGAIERAAGEALGRDLRIAGTLRLAYSFEPGIVVEDVTLSNTSWGSDPAMIHVDRVELVVDLPSVWNPPIRVKDVALDGVRVLLERNAGGEANWDFDLKPGPPGPKPVRPVVVDHAGLRDFELVYRPRPDATPLRVGVRRLEARHDAASDMVKLEAEGHFNEAPWDLAGTLGTLDRLYAVRDVSHDLTGHIGKARLALRGRIRDPLKLSDPEVEAEIDGPDVAAALATVSLRSPLSGPFHARSRFRPVEGGVEIDASAGLNDVAVTARGRVGALLAPDPIDATVEASGPDAAGVGAWFGITGVPERPFTLEGRIRREGAGLSIADVKARVGETTLTVAGAIGTQPRGVGTDLSVTATGPDLAGLSAITRLKLPAGAFSVRGRFERGPLALAVRDVELRAQDAVVRGGGTIGEPPALANLDLVFDVAGSDLSRFSSVSGVALPQGSFELRGNIARDGEAFALHGVDGRLGDNAVKVEGRLVPRARLLGSELRASVVGPDLAVAGSLVGLRGLAAVPYDLAGRVRIAADGYHLDGVSAQAGALAGEVAGRIGPRPVDDGMELEGRVAGRTLAELSAWGVRRELPGDPFEVSGHLRLSGGVFSVERGAAEVGDDRLSVDGTLGPLPDLSRLDLAVTASGPRLSDVGRFVVASDGAFPTLPDDAYRVAAKIRRVPEGLELREVRSTVGAAELGLDGILGTGEGLTGTNLRFEARAQDSSAAAALAGVSLPAGPMTLSGGIERVDAGFRFDGVAATIGDARATVSGILGGPPERAGTDFEVVVAGPDLDALLGPITGLSPLPAEAFEVRAQLGGNARRISSKRFAAKLGENDLEGSIDVELEGRPSIEAELRSSHLGITQLLDGFLGEPAPATAAPEPVRRADRKKVRFIPDEPLELASMGSLDARIRLEAAEVVIPAIVLHDVHVEAAVRDGALHVERAEGSGVYGGRATARLSLEPVVDGYRLRASGELAGGRLVPAKEEVPPERAPSVDVTFEVDGSGRSLRAIAATSRGGALVTVGAGRLATTRGGFVTNGVLRGLLDALNPFRKSAPFTELECVVAVADIAAGKATVEPVAARTDKLTVIGRGKVDLESEAIDFVWTLKPRRGVGISAGSITNPYIKLGGTLMSPSLEAKPLEAAASTGAAVATAGLTVLFRGLYDRITAEKKVCVRALETAEKQEAAREAEREAERSARPAP